MRDPVRGQRVVFDGIYKKLQHELAEKKKRMAEIIEVANVAYEARDRAQAEISSLKLQSEKEQGEFEMEWKELGRKLEEDRQASATRAWRGWGGVRGVRKGRGRGGMGAVEMWRGPGVGHPNPRTVFWCRVAAKARLALDRKRQDFLARERQRLMQLEQRGEMSVEDERDLKKLVRPTAVRAAAIQP